MAFGIPRPYLPQQRFQCATATFRIQGVKIREKPRWVGTPRCPVSLWIRNLYLFDLGDGEKLLAG